MKKNLKFFLVNFSYLFLFLSDHMTYEFKVVPQKQCYCFYYSITTQPFVYS